MIAETLPTIGLNVSKCDFQGVQFQFWDLGGDGDLPKLWEKYYAEAHLVFFVLDSTAEFERMQRVRGSLEKLFRNVDVDGIPVAILANKLDLSSHLNVKNSVSVVLGIKETFNPLMASIEARESKVFGVSALTGFGVMEALEWMFQAVENNALNRMPNFV